MQISITDIQTLVGMLDQSSLSELTLESGDLKLHLKKPSYEAAVLSAAAPVHAPVAVPTLATLSQAPGSQLAEAAPPEAAASKGGTIIRSPMVGTFYSSPSPEAGPYVEVGSRVEQGQVVCIIEAMKLMNEIEAEASGTIRQIFVRNGDPVEFGQPLMEIG